MAEWHILIEMKKDVIVASESDVIVYLDGVNPKTQPATVRENGNYSNITLTIPHDWEYETERKNDSIEYCIAIWPEGQTAGKRLRYGIITLLVFAEPVLSRKKSPLAVIAHGKEPMITRSIGII